MWTDPETGKMAKARLSEGIWYVHGSETDGMVVATDILAVLEDNVKNGLMETNGCLQYFFHTKPERR